MRQTKSFFTDCLEITRIDRFTPFQQEYLQIVQTQEYHREMVSFWINLCDSASKMYEVWQVACFRQIF